MDYQNGVVAMLGEPDDLLSLAEGAIATVRRAGGVIVLADATADPDPEVHAFLTERIFPRQADVITVRELEGLLSGS
jgi:hypothetical protein